MAYINFSLDELQQKFGIKNQIRSLFAPMTPIKLSEWLKTTFENAADLPTRTEKAKSESIIFPLLMELRNNNDKFFTIYSGDNLNVNEKEGLNGECDFILAKDIHTFNINYPILALVEAKNSDIAAGVPQCAAQMLGAKIFNEQKNTPLSVIYGCVTTGNDWKFLQLIDNQIIIDKRTYYFNEIEEILAVFQHIINIFREELK